MKVMVGINTLSVLDQLAYANHIQFFYRMGRNHPDVEFGLSSPRRMSIDRMRNTTAKIAVDNNFDYLMFIDDDVLVPFDAFQKLRDCNADIAAGWTIIRGYPFNNMFFKFQDESRQSLIHYNDAPENSIVDCDAVGFSCVLIKVDLLKKVPPPYFVTGTHNTEDIYFCLKAKEAVPDCKIVVDTSVKTAHIMGSEVISPMNKAAYTKFVEETDSTVKPQIKDDNKVGDRGNKYFEMVKEVTKRLEV